MEEKKNLIFDTELAQNYYTIIGPWEDYLNLTLKKELNRRFQGIAQKSALEIGCGPGRRAALLRELGFEVTTCELSPHMLVQAKFNLKDKAEVLEIDAHDMPFDDNSFDISFLVLSLGCVRDHVQVLREAVRVSRQCVFVAEINPFSILGLRFFYERHFKHNVFKAMRFYTPWKLKAIIKGIPGIKDISSLNHFWNPFRGFYVFVSDLYYDKILTLKPLSEAKVKSKISKAFAIVFKHMGGKNEKGLSI